ncbi:MAG: GNAT family N-acetyltransferase [Sideroxydans sp.]|nr:GNAT family N-acetyltransferase [Sideroxydans sp.]
MLILPLTGSHDRQEFDCGRPELNDWLCRIARQHQQKGLSKTFVAVLDEAPSAICGYYALTLTEVDTRPLPEARRKKLPRLIPGIRLGRLAVDTRFQGRRLGELLLVDAIERVRLIHQHAGVVGLFVDAIDDKAAAFYTHFGFEAFVDDPLKLFLPVR